MGVTGSVLHGLGDTQLPQHAAPIVRDLNNLLERADRKMVRYGERSVGRVLMKLDKEKRELEYLTHEIQQRLPLLTICVASANDTSGAIHDLQGRISFLQHDSANAAAHLRYVADMVHLLTQHAARHEVTAPEVEQHLTQLRNSMRKLHNAQDGAVDKVLDGCFAMHQHLGAGVARVLQDVRELHRTARGFVSMNAQLEEIRGAQGEMLDRQDAMLSKQGEMMEFLKQLVQMKLGEICGPDAAAEVMRSDRSLLALEELHSTGDLRAVSGEGPLTIKSWAAAMKKAIVSKRLQISACLVLGMPFMRKGPLRPVTMSCCHLVVSHAGAEMCVSERKCQLCNVAEPTFMVDGAAADAVAHAAIAEECGISPPLLEESDISILSTIASGGEGTAYEGRLRTTAVAVKKVKLGKRPSKAEEIAGVRQVVMASYLAGIASPHVCSLHGYCWTDSEVWLAIELCQGTLVDLVDHAATTLRTPGLPELDVITLGLMLCCALHAVHHGACYLHLDVKPANVLYKAPNGGASSSGSSGFISNVTVVLTDFGTARHLPHQLAHLLQSSSDGSEPQDVEGARGTAGYASPEQMDGRAQRRSDVYGMGATLAYAITGKPPYGTQGIDTESYRRQLDCRRPMENLQYIVDPDLKDLLSAMLAFDVKDRPPLTDVQQRLQRLYDERTAQGKRPQLLAPLTDVRPAPPTPPVPCPVLCTTAHKPTAASPGMTDDTYPLGSCMSHETHMPIAVEVLYVADAGSPGHSDDLSATNSLHASAESLSETAVYVASMHSVAELGAWLESHTARDSVSLLRATLTLPPNGRRVPQHRRSLNVMQELSNRECLPWRTQMAIEETVVVHVSSGGGVVQDAAIRLGRTGLLIIDGSCEVAFLNTTFEGGTVICQGAHAELALVRCQFVGCVLVALDGAAVNIDHVQFSGLVDALRCYAITARGACTTVEAQYLRIEAWAGLLIEQSAHFTGEHVHLEQFSCVGVHVRDAHTVLNVSGCRLVGRAGRTHSAFQVAWRATVNVSGSKVRACGDGVHAMEGAVVSVKDSQIQSCANRGVHVDNASVTLEAVEIVHARGTGILASGERGSVVATRCEVTQPRSHGARVIKGATANLTKCVLREALHGGLLVEGGGSNATLDNCKLCANTMVGVRVSGGASATLIGCDCTPGRGADSRPADHQISGGGSCYEVHAGAELSVQGGACRMPAKARAAGCAVEGGGRLIANRLEVVGGAAGVMFLRGSTGRLYTCTIQGCSGNGVEVLDEASLLASGCRISECRGHGVAVCQEPMRTLAQRAQRELPGPCSGCQRAAGLCVGELGPSMHGGHAWLPRGGAAAQEPAYDLSVSFEHCVFTENEGFGICVFGRRQVKTAECKYRANRGGSFKNCAVGGAERPATAAGGACVRAAGAGLWQQSPVAYVRAGLADMYTTAGDPWQMELDQGSDCAEMEA